MKIYPEDTDLSVFASDQISVWPLAKDNYRALKSVRTRAVKVGGLDAVLQYNPARIVSSSAKIDRESLSARECFLCRGHRGDQSYIPFHGKKGREYDVLLNPYPIFPRHFTVPLSVHTEQSIWRRYPDMLSLALKYQDYTMIYNGPLCGASAPDHHHFQAVPAGRLPMENALVQAFRERGGVLGHVVSYGTAELFHVDLLTNGVFALRSTSAKDMAKLFYRLIDCMPEVPGQSEPMINLLSFYRDKAYYSIVYMRKAHRSHQGRIYCRTGKGLRESYRQGFGGDIGRDIDNFGFSGKNHIQSVPQAAFCRSGYNVGSRNMFPSSLRRRRREKSGFLGRENHL